MGYKMNEKLLKLLEVKSIVTIIVTLVFAILSIRGVISGESTMNVIILVIGSYFNYQQNKNTNNKGDKE